MAAMTTPSPFDNFEAFWPFYLGEHRLPATRQFHFLGTTVGLVLLSFGQWIAAPVVAYACAWVGHFVFEKNKPATFKHPLWSFRGDLRMYKMMLLGELDAELARLAIAPASMTSHE